MSVPILERGQRISDGQNGSKYEVVRQMSPGSYSRVYVVANTRYPSIEQVLKINLADGDLDPGVSQVVRENSRVFGRDARTNNEIEMLTRLNHPNILKISDVVDLGEGYRGILTEPIKKAVTLREMIGNFNSSGNYSYLNNSPEELLKLLSAELQAKKPTAPLDTAAMPRTIKEMLENMGSETYSRMFSVFHSFMRLLPQACEVITYLREQRLNHRDIGPQNILVDANLNLYLLDFGISFPFIEPEHLRSQEERREFDSIAGGVFYRDPLMQESGKFPRTGDLWSWGLVFYELLTGTHLITGKPRESSSRDEMADFNERFKSFWLKNVEPRPPTYDPATQLIAIPSDQTNLERLVVTSFDKVYRSFYNMAKAEWIPVLQELEFIPGNIVPQEADSYMRDDTFWHTVRNFSNSHHKDRAIEAVMQKQLFYFSLLIDFLSHLGRTREQNFDFKKNLSIGSYNEYRTGH